MPKSTFVHSLLRGYGGRAPKSVRDALHFTNHRSTQHKARSRRRKTPKYLKIVYNGQYTRIKVPSIKNARQNTSQKSTTQNAQGNHLKTQNNTTTNNSRVQGKKVLAINHGKNAAGDSSVRKSFFKWLRSNLPVLTLNLGSICILVGFSRSDVLELRALTMTGQLTFAFYNLSQPKILWPSVVWSTLFATVNAKKIFNIFQERRSEVVMTEEQERIFVDHFMGHGVTPLQFQWIYGKAKKIKVKKGTSVIEKGDIMDQVFLVAKGTTHNHVEGRKLTPDSAQPDFWIGEMSFLDWFYCRHEDDSSVEEESGDSSSLKFGRGVSMYSVLADDDCDVLAWDHEAMEELMEISVDLRAAMTRAMTAAVSTKVINLTIAKVDASKNWISSWLSNWSPRDGSRVQLDVEK